MNRSPEQTAVVRREVRRKRKQMPLRQLLAEAPDVLLAILPCWMASPLAVSQLLDARRRYLDIVVIFDEASQVPRKMPSAQSFRGDHTVAAGDRKQLPPTMFFAAGVGDDDGDASESGDVSGFESVSTCSTHFSLRGRSIGTTAVVMKP